MHRENRVLRDRAMNRGMRKPRVRDMEMERSHMMYDGRSRRRDMSFDRDYAYEESNYYDDLDIWSKKLKKFDKFGLSKEEIIDSAKSMGAKFDNYDEHEIVATYYMLMSDFPNALGNYQGYIKMAIDFLEDNDVAYSGSEKLCKYMYAIVLGED